MYKAFLTGIIIIIVSCTKEIVINEPEPIKSLLTEKPWLLTSYGFDENRNNQTDPAEESIEDCQKDNTWHYYPDGTGLVDDNTLSCATGIEKQPFTWKLVQDNTILDFFYDSLKILKINSHEMHLFKELNEANGNTTKLIFVLKR